MKNFLKELLIVIIYAVTSLSLYLIFPNLRLEWIFTLSLIPIAVISFFFPIAINIFLALLSAHLVFLSFPDTDFEFLIYFAFIPVYFIVQNTKSYKSLFFYGIITGIMFMAGGFYWLNHTLVIFGHLSQTEAIPVFILYSIAFSLKFPALFMGLRWIGNNLKISRFITFPIIITLADFLIYELFPWYFGNSQYKNIYLIQIAELTGVCGITFIIAYVNTMFYEIVLYFKQRKSFPKIGLIIGFILFGSSMLFGFFRMEQIKDLQKSAEGITISCVQPNTPIFNKSYFKIFNTLKELSLKSARDQHHKRKVELIVWPESAAPFSYNDKPPSNFNKILNAIAKKYDTYILFGETDKEKVNNKTYWFNSSRLLSPDLKVSKPYHKIYLLPFGEYMPLGDLFPSLYKISPNLSSGFKKGESIDIFHHPKAKLAPQICYEIIIPSYTRKFINKGGEVIINITNDMWFGDTKASKQHLVLALFRAIENRVPIVRSTNSGITTFVNPLGEISSDETPLYKEAVLTHTIYPPKIKGVYTHIGDLFSYILLGIAVIIIIFRRKLNQKI